MGVTVTLTHQILSESNGQSVLIFKNQKFKTYNLTAQDHKQAQADQSPFQSDP